MDSTEGVMGDTDKGGAVEKKNESRRRRYWTNQRHMHFLASMEASFVRSMMQYATAAPLRLDRFLPDTSDSTRDHLRTKTHSGINCEKEERKPSSLTIAQLEDQVVPQFPNIRDNYKDKKDDDTVVPQ